MATSRRAVLASLPAAVLAPLAAIRTGWGMPNAAQVFVTTCRDWSGHAAAILDASGRRCPPFGFPAVATALPLPRTGGRRWSLPAVRVDSQSFSTSSAGWRSSNSRRLPAHTSADTASSPRTLAWSTATENDYGSERGVLGVYDASGACRRSGELDTHGIGPHEAVLMRDGCTVAVANGGIATHPDFPRRKLNLGSMEPSLVHLDLATGDLLERATPPDRRRKLSIRHIVEAESGIVWFGGQYEGPRSDQVEIVGFHRRGENLALVPAPRTVNEAMKGYVGSVAASRDGAQVAVTSPRGGVLTIWNAQSRQVKELRRIADVCGVAPGVLGFVASDGKGRLWREGEVISSDAVQWDNHLAAAARADRAECAA